MVKLMGAFDWFFYLLRSMSWVCVLCVVSACSSLPQKIDKPPSYAYTDTQNTKLGKAVKPLVQNKESKTGFLPLGSGVNAFTARYVLSNLAERSIDAQYYIWHDDMTGKLLVHALLEAADRGVRVRLLLDDINMAGKDNALITLHAHPNIEVRLFNPFVNRSFRAMDVITDFSRINRRMHNKSFTFDNQVTIVGGRNIGDEYFDANPSTDIQDFDLLAIGDVVNEVSNQFDKYWNSKFAFPVDSLVSKAEEDTAGALKKRLDQHVMQAGNTVYVDAVKQSQLLAHLKDKTLSFFWSHAQVLYDEPEKIELDEDDTSTHLRSRLDPLVADTRQEIIIISPYFIPGDDGVERMSAANARGVKVSVLTNSLASTDVPLVYSGYSPYRVPLLKAGVDLYEMKATYKSTQKVKLMDVSSRASLHSKVYIFDRQHLFVGSYNLDPRSTKINTEMGIYITNAELAERFAEWWENSVGKLAYKLELEFPDGKPDRESRLVWLDLTQDPVVRYEDEPKVDAWDKFKNSFFSVFPIEGQL